MSRSRDTTIEVDDFLVMRRPPLTAELQSLTGERDRLNAEYLAGLPALPGGGALTGSFICAHPPDYRGRPTLRYSQAEWRGLFRELKQLGIGTVIMQASAWVDFAECYYPSRLFAGFRTWNVLDPLIEASVEESMVLYLGGVGVLHRSELGADTADLGKARDAADRELRCWRELTDRYGGAFQGYYLSPETGFNPGSNHYAAYREFFLRATNGVKAMDAAMPILASPYTVFRPGMEQEILDRLTYLHEGCPISILAPQDSVGALNLLRDLDKGLAIWQQVCGAIGAEFWGNCESFSIVDFNGPVCSIEPAEFARFAVQLDAAERAGARRMVTWEAPFFMAEEGSAGARRLRGDYLANRRMRIPDGRPDPS